MTNHMQQKIKLYVRIFSFIYSLFLIHYYLFFTTTGWTQACLVSPTR